MKLILQMFQGFCMALADSVPGVSGGTVAFIMGFYDKFIGAIHDVIFGDMERKKKGLSYLVKLGLGWIIGMAGAVVVLTNLFDSHIYVVSSLFIGFIAASIPLIVMEEKESLKDVKSGAFYLVAGIALVVIISWANGGNGGSTMDLSVFSLGQAIKLFMIGMVAISAMFLPGISGSTLLLIFGAYIPVMSAVRGFMGMDFSYFPSLVCFGLGVLTGAATVVKGVKVCLEKFRTQTIYGIIGMMIGSFYAIVMGPTTLSVPKPAMGLSQFSFVACFFGVVLVFGMQWLKTRERNEVSA